MSRAHRPKLRRTGSLDRRAAFRVKPPGQTGRPRKHYPPVFEGRSYMAKLITSVRGTYQGLLDDRGEYAIVQEVSKKFRIWSCDEVLSKPIDTRAEAVKLARRHAAEFDRKVSRKLRADSRLHLNEFLDEEIPKLLALSNEQKIASGRQIEHGARSIWKSREHLLCLPDESTIVSEEWVEDCGDFGYSIRKDIRMWLRENDIFAVLYNLPFAELSHGGRRHPVFTYVLSFREADHMVWFKLRWWGDDHLPT